MNGTWQHSRFDGRTYPPHENVRWTPSVGARPQIAAVSDESKSGIGLVLASPVLPHPGGIVRIKSCHRALVRAARVVRITIDCLGTAHVGCRWISSRPRHDGGERARRGREQV